MKKLNSFLLFVIFLFPLLCLAQWSSDPSVNTEIKNSSDWEVIPKIVTDQNGNSYVSWFSGDATLNFNVYMQRLDSEGNKLWGTEGLLISDNPTWSWVTDYSLILDGADNAVLATQDVRTGSSNAYAYRMSQNADFLWGDNGVTLSNNTNFNPFPKVIETSDGDFIFVFDRDQDLKSDLERITMQKVSASGNVLWGDGKEISNDTLKYYFSVPIYTEDDQYIVAWLYRPENDTVFPGHPVFFHIYTQKFDLGGNPVWPDPVRVDTGNIMSYLDDFVILQLANDGNGGVFISWDTEIYNLGNIVVQHIDQNGNLDWPYPIEVSTNYNNERWEPNIYADINNQELYLFWVEYHYDGVNLLDCFGIGGQKLSFAGQRMWSNTAKIFVELDCNNDTAYFDQIIRPSTENDIAVFYIKTFVNFGPPDTLIEGEIYAMRINPAGEFVWPSERVTVSSYPGDKCYIAVSECKANQWIATWSDIRGSKTPDDVSDYGIYAQNVHLDGSLGPLGIDDYSSINSASVVIYPNPFNGNTTINIELNSAEKICLSLYNLHGQLITNISDDWLNPGNNIYHYDGSYLDAGIYFLELKNGNNRLYTKMVKVD